MTPPSREIAFNRKHLRIPVLATRETRRNANKEVAAPQILSKDFGIRPRNSRGMPPSNSAKKECSTLCHEPANTSRSAPNQIFHSSNESK
ncbi:hypothetical protein QL285_022786 [Trifolium repens]|nr:hypothetical protein QL285_022786 [Trifolium repens]